jgi:hypothetical protein
MPFAHMFDILLRTKIDYNNMLPLSQIWKNYKNNKICHTKVWLKTHTDDYRKNKLHWDSLIIFLIHFCIDFFFVNSFLWKRKYSFINQSDQIIFHTFTDSLFRNDNINRKYNSSIRKFEDHTKSYICFDTFENPRLLLCSHTICFQCIRVGTRINRNFDCTLRDSIKISQQ